MGSLKKKMVRLVVMVVVAAMISLTFRFLST